MTCSAVPFQRVCHMGFGVFIIHTDYSACDWLFAVEMWCVSSHSRQVHCEVKWSLLDAKGELRPFTQSCFIVHCTLVQGVRFPVGTIYIALLQNVQTVSPLHRTPPPFPPKPPIYVKNELSYTFILVCLHGTYRDHFFFTSGMCSGIQCGKLACAYKIKYLEW
jgi:hypothetical protein